MFEIKNGQNYEIYNKINPDPITWKRYENNLTMNSHNMMELTFDVSDTVLSGSGNSVE